MLLIGTTTWAVEGSDNKARQQVRYLDLMEKCQEQSGFDFIVVDNNSTNPIMIDRLKSLTCKVIYNKENFGWAVPRNQMMQVFSKGTWSHLVMQDSDIFFYELDWPKRLLEILGKLPWLHTCQIRPASGNGSIEGFLETVEIDGVVLNNYQQYLGGTDVIDRFTLKLYGGYDWKAVPFKWGWHDIEYGVRFEVSNAQRREYDGRIVGPHFDPLCFTTGIHDDEQIGMGHESNRAAHVNKTTPYFMKKLNALRALNTPLFFDYNLMPKSGEILD